MHIKVIACSTSVRLVSVTLTEDESVTILRALADLTILVNVYKNRKKIIHKIVTQIMI